ncbi:MAG: methionyl-tRNA formyltransferase [Gallionella sp.]
MKIIFAGTPQFAADALAAILSEHQVVAVLTQPDRPAGRGMQLTASPVKQLALQRGIPVWQPSSLKTPEIQAQLAELNADAMVVAAYGLILPKAVLDMPRYGCLNIHASLLPRWRGAAPIQRALQAGDVATGITIMQMDVGLDTGAMLTRHVCPIRDTDTASSLHDKLAELGATSVVTALRDLANLTPVAQNDADATYASKLLKSESPLDWSLDAPTLARTVRAFNPFPLCNFSFNQAVIKVWQASAQHGAGVAGTVLSLDKLGIVVACGTGALRLEVLQRPGGKAQPAAQFLQSVHIKVGDMLTVK